MRNIITYVPEETSQKCLVYRLFLQTKKATILKLLRFARTKPYLIISNEPKLDALVNANKIRTLSCVGCRDEEFPIIKTTDRKYLAAEWFDNSVEVAVFFVRNGASMFANNSDWSKIFGSWISFDETFQANINYKDFLDLQEDLYENLLMNIRTSKKHLELKRNLEKTYSKYIDLICIECDKKNKNVSDLIMAMHCLLANKKALVCG